MDEKDLKKLDMKGQFSLFKVNIFYYLFVAFMIALNWLSCCSSINDFNQVVKNFKLDHEIECSNTFVSKKRGWSIDESRDIFIKGDNFIEIKKCKGE